MTSGLLVSTEMNTSDSRRSASMTGTTRAQFLVESRRARAGTRGFAADVDDRGALLDHAPRVRERRGGREEPAAVGEGIGRDVEHAHDHGRARSSVRSGIATGDGLLMRDTPAFGAAS